VGSIYLAFNHTNPATLFGGTWVRIYGAFPWFTDANGEIGLTGGERTVTLTEKQIPAHNHGGTYTNAGTARTHAWLASGGSAMGFDTVESGGGEAHNNMPPYIQIAAWRRTA
jgi:microcystin-dependent protein